MLGISEAAESIGFRTMGVKIVLNQLLEIELPAILHWNQNHFVEIVLTNGLITTYKKELPYLPNMQGQADIITDDISLLERLVLPIKKILTESI